MDDDATPEPSAMEIRLSRLGVTAPDLYRASERIDWIHDHNLAIADQATKTPN
jgi:hypothetical protein